MTGRETSGTARHEAPLRFVPALVAAADILNRISPSPARGLSAAIQFLYPDRSGTVQRLALPSRLTEQSWVERLVTTSKPGDHVAAPPAAAYDDRLAHWIVRGTGPAQCAARLSQIEDALELLIAPPARTTACSR
ncbi:hypothetical protein GCM10010306_091060 [Streptomyces umbrinus]|uniref:hypothetical protein n=1 Tax=Streptomyces umbrinus TaxID=67370 RepID=UPI001676D0BE|nr:hypothetical protein [Streptomyces umbrinus]GHB82276.1 hypothetical protein GCM10010306_091060 [Streptomyces umbrinus]